MHHKHGIRQNVKAVCCWGRGSKSLEGYALKTTPPITRVKCQNFQNLGKRKKSRLRYF